MHVLLFSLFLALILTSLPAQAETTSSYRCVFDKGGYAGNWNMEDKFKSEKSTFSNDKTASVVIFDGIDFETDTARLIGNAGNVSVSLIQSGDTLSFLEITETGNQIMTSIFLGSRLKTDAFPSVMSRHVTLIKPIVSQYYGECHAL